MSKDEKLDDIRKIILSLLVARKGATPLPVLEKDYYEAESRRIPYRRFGYSDLMGFLESMPEHFVIEQHNNMHFVRGIASEKSKHVGSLVARQKMPQKPPRYVPSHLRQASFNQWRVQHMKSQQIKIAPDKLFYLMHYVKNNPQGVSLQNAVAHLQGKVPYISITTQGLRAQLGELQHQLYLDGNMIYPKNLGYQQSLIKERQRNEVQSDSGLLAATQTECAAGQEDFDVQYYSDDDFLPADSYQRHEETSEQFAASQYANYEQTGMFKVQDNGMEIRENFAKNSNMKKTVEYQDLSQIISDRTKSRLEELMRKNPEGIWCAELPKTFFQEYKVHLNYTQLGFASVREFTSYLPKIFYMKQINKTDDFMLYSADKRPIVPKSDPIDAVQTNQFDEHSTTQYNKDDDDDDNNAPIPSDVSPTITKSFAPNDVMNYDDNVEKISVVELKRNNKHLGVYVVEVFHPNFFWVQLRENRRRFNKMMDELFDFYECNKNIYTIAKIALKKDMNCACVYMNRWHRGIIKSVKQDFRVTIFFYDYGTLKMYAPEDVYYLHKKFSSLPAQAIPCGLFNVVSNVGDRWKKSVIGQFIDKIADTLLAATIISVDPTYNSMMVILTDTSEEEDVDINKWLVNERLAQVGKTADSVDMASLMKYVVNNLNQLPTYCFAEENLMPDNCCKVTSTKEKYEVPLVSSGPTLHYDNHQQQPVRPPPGFTALDEQHVPSNLLTNFHNGYSFANASNVKASIFSDTEATNPFLTEQEVISDDVAIQLYTSVWNENKKLQIRMVDILYDLIEQSSLSLKNQVQLNKILKTVEKILLELKDRSTVETPSASNPTSETSSNNVGFAQKTADNLNGETSTKQDLDVNTFLMSNPFSVNSDDRPQSNSAFSFNSDFTFNTNWSNPDELNPHVQTFPSTAANSAPSTFTNHISSINTLLPNTNQDGENVSLTPVSSAVPTSTSNSFSISNFSKVLEDMKTQFANMCSKHNGFKNTNPFKSPDETQAPETQNERTSYNANFASYLSSKNPQSHASKAETANIPATSSSFTPAGHAGENYTSKLVYESGPVMYNVQKKLKTDANTRQNTCGNNLDDTQSTQSRELGQDKKPTSQTANDIVTSYMQNPVISEITRDNFQVDKNYVTQPLAYYTKEPITNSEPTYYQQNSNANDLRSVSSQSWNQIKIPEYQANSKIAFQTSVPLSNHSETGLSGTSISLAQNWKYNVRKIVVPRKIKKAIDSNYIFQCKDDYDKERPMDIYMNSWNSTVNGSIQEKNATVNLNTFIFQKIDSVNGVTFIFNIEKDGWILTYEFIEAFTNLKLHSLLTTLETMNTRVIFKEIHRSEYPIQFLELDRYPLNVPRDSEKRIISINLISLQNALMLLHKLKIVSREEIENAFKKNEFLDDSMLSNLWILIIAYRNLKQRIELCSNYI